MEISLLTFLGIFAASMTTGAFIPQVIRTWKTRSTGDLSLGMFLMLFIGTGCWLLYGLIKKDLPLILANGLTWGLSFVILFFKVRDLRSVSRVGSKRVSGRQ